MSYFVIWLPRIKSGYEWEMGSIRRVVPITSHKVMNPRPRTFYVGQKVIAFFGDALPNATSAKDASFPVGACGVVAYTNENLRLARAGAVLNLLNLIPVWVLDGGQAAGVLGLMERAALLAMALGLWFYTRDGIFALFQQGADQLDHLGVV